MVVNSAISSSVCNECHDESDFIDQGNCTREYLSRLSYVLVRNEMHMWSQYYIFEGYGMVNSMEGEG